METGERGAGNDSVTKKKRGKSNLDKVPDFSVGDGHFHACEVRVEPSLQGSHKLYAGRLAGVDCLNRLRHVRCNGLLAENVLPVRCAGFDLSAHR